MKKKLLGTNHLLKNITLLQSEKRSFEAWRISVFALKSPRNVTDFQPLLDYVTVKLCQNERRTKKLIK